MLLLTEMAEKKALKESGEDFLRASNCVEKYFAAAYTYDTLTEQAVYDICLGVVSGARDSLDVIRKKSAGRSKGRPFDSFLSDMSSAFTNFCLALFRQAKKYGLRESVAGSKPDSRRMRETANLPAIAQVAGVAVNPKITQVVRQSTIYDTVAEMGLSVKINAMKNVVAEVPDMPTAGAVLQKIYQAFGVKGSFMVTWDGKGKLYWDPKTPVDKATALAYAKQAGLPPPNFTKLLA